MLNDVGMGKPSKYLLLPEASLGSEETVTLKRARRVRPHKTKKDRRRVSAGVRRPKAKAALAGATPKDTFFVYQWNFRGCEIVELKERCLKVKWWERHVLDRQDCQALVP